MPLQHLSSLSLSRQGALLLFLDRYSKPGIEKKYNNWRGSKYHSQCILKERRFLPGISFQGHSRKHHREPKFNGYNPKKWKIYLEK